MFIAGHKLKDFNARFLTSLANKFPSQVSPTYQNSLPFFMKIFVSYCTENITGFVLLNLCGY